MILLIRTMLSYSPLKQKTQTIIAQATKSPTQKREIGSDSRVGIRIFVSVASGQSGQSQTVKVILIRKVVAS